MAPQDASVISCLLEHPSRRACGAPQDEGSHIQAGLLGRWDFSNRFRRLRATSRTPIQHLARLIQVRACATLSAPAKLLAVPTA